MIILHKDSFDNLSYICCKLDPLFDICISRYRNF